MNTNLENQIWNSSNLPFSELGLEVLHKSKEPPNTGFCECVGVGGETLSRLLLPLPHQAPSSTCLWLVSIVFLHIFIWPLFRRSSPFIIWYAPWCRRGSETYVLILPLGQNHTCKFPCMWLVHDDFLEFTNEDSLGPGLHKRNIKLIMFRVGVMSYCLLLWKGLLIMFVGRLIQFAIIKAWLITNLNCFFKANSKDSR